jgi:hypothetical protein
VRLINAAVSALVTLEFMSNTKRERTSTDDSNSAEHEEDGHPPRKTSQGVKTTSFSNALLLKITNETPVTENDRGFSSI